MPEVSRAGAIPCFQIAGACSIMVDQTPLTPERWQQIEQLFSDIEERPADRAALLAAADPVLRETVEKMVAASHHASPLDEPPPPVVPDDSGPPPSMLGPYRIEAPLGQGGMGRVFRATDTRLHRSVAIKIPAERFSERFEREARAIAALNHPHICTLYDVGPAYLVMELVGGETLAARLLRGRLPLEQTVEYGAQIASALAAAHARGIVHRDLKPSNIMLTKSGVKLLDFGLSRSFEDVHATAEWERMGTPAYMAPEQFDGQATDTRTDIYAFGLVLYEMATGSRPSAKPAAALPPALDRLVRRCLEAAPDDRWQSARDLEWELRSVLTVPATAPARPRHWRHRLFGAVFGLLALFLVGLAFIHFSEAPPRPAAVRMSVLLPEKSRFRALRVSPDGRQIATILVQEGKQQIWIRALDSLEFTALAGTDGAASPFWSPDSRYVGFFADAKVKKIERSGGPVQTLCDALGGMGGTWNRNGDILFSSDALGRVQRVSAGGGAPSDVPYEPGIAQTYPFFLPDGQHYLARRRRAPGSADSGIWLSSIASPESRQILPDFSNPEFVEPIPGGRVGQVLFTRNGMLMALPFDTKRLEPAGNVVPVAQAVAGSSDHWTSSRGLLAYVSGQRASRQYTWRDRKGRNLGVAGDAGAVVVISPDGRRLVGDHNGIRVLDFARGAGTQITFGGIGQDPVWSSDGRYIAFGRGGGIYRKLASGAGVPELLTPGESLMVPKSWSPDGRFLMYAQLNPGTAADLLAIPMDGERKPFVVVQSSANEDQGQFSPDGHWVAYTSNESGLSEIYVIPFPPSPSGGRWLVSKGGGVMPRWRRDGKELFYISPDSQMMAADVTTNPVFKSGNPQALFQTDMADTRIRTGPMSWDIAPDGRFLIISETSTDASITVVLNWRAGESN
jgi:eukaryotic-like serine/threonine-protein kinase